jgi:hypothetical protein
LIRVWAEVEREDFINATVMIGLTFVDQYGAERFESFIGRVVGFKNGELYKNLGDGSPADTLCVECHDGEIRDYPFDLDVFEPADPGIYKLPDGATIENPDYILQWRITEPAKH